MLQFMDCVDYVHFPIFLSGWITFWATIYTFLTPPEIFRSHYLSLSLSHSHSLAFGIFFPYSTALRCILPTRFFSQCSFYSTLTESQWMDQNGERNKNKSNNNNRKKYIKLILGIHAITFYLTPSFFAFLALMPSKSQHFVWNFSNVVRYTFALYGW